MELIIIKKLLINQKKPEKTALIDNNKYISYKDLQSKAADLQQELKQYNKKNAAVFLHNDSNFVSALFALFMLDITVLPLNFNLTKHEIIPLLKQAEISIVITKQEFSHVFEEIKKEIFPSLIIVYFDKLPRKNNKLLIEDIESTSDKPTLLLTTSGSTGIPKIVSLSESNIAASALGYLDKMKFENRENIPEVRYILSLPFTSSYGIMILCACFMKSFPIILMNNCFTLNAFYKLAERYNATNYEGAGSVLLMMEQMSDRPITYDISQLKDFGFGGSKVSGNILRKLRIAFPDVRFWQGYGMTETSPLITKYANYEAEKLDSVGTAIKDVEIAIYSETGITKEPYIHGEVIVKGPNVMLGYYNNEEETRKILKNGYLHTGDIGYLDDEGYLFICGRKKNIIIVGGNNVHPEEVEDCLFDSQLIKDCVVYGIADTSGNEEVCADIVLINSQVKLEDVMVHCNNHLALYKHPKRFNLVREIKKGVSGKVDRAEKV